MEQPYRTPTLRPRTAFRVTRWMKLRVIYLRGSLGGFAGDFSYHEPRPWVQHFLRVLLRTRA